jgi:hypothetical protein
MRPRSLRAIAASGWLCRTWTPVSLDLIFYQVSQIKMNAEALAVTFRSTVGKRE